ncbi:MAG: hypothetical protein NVSMB66_7490 [Candidatus Doudnabacteria bacterium]
MKKSVLITGVSGAGKSSISQKLNDVGCEAYDLDDIPGLFSMVHKKTGNIIIDPDDTNLEKLMETDWICDKEMILSMISNQSAESAFYCGGASNLDELLPLFDAIILLKLDPEVMRQRLGNRTENDFGKTADVQSWIISEKEGWENSIQKKGAIVIDAHQSLNKVVKEILEKKF